MKNIICNPLNLPYRYQQQIPRMTKEPLLSREGADPTMLLFKDKYLLFVSMSGGFWYSDDLLDWKFHETPELPIHDYAPDVRVVDGKVVFSASAFDTCRLYVSEDPLNHPFIALPEEHPWWDPNVFQDDDGRVYLYWGCSTKPMWAEELDRLSLKPISKKVNTIAGNPKEHGWERPGDNNVVAKPATPLDKILRVLFGGGPYIEGTYVNKHDGHYYLQYAAPGTEYNVYGDGVYVSESPMGPWTYQKHNPFSSVPGGFITGAGHGSTFQDKNGKWWHVATMRISVNEKFERRVGLFPCDFDDDGILHCDQALADYPFDAVTGQKMDWMLLNGVATASSSHPGHEPEKCCNEDVRTWWAAENTDADQWLMLDFGEIKTVNAVQVNFADQDLVLPKLEKTDYFKLPAGYRKIYVQDQPTKYILEGSADGKHWTTLQDRTDGTTDCCHDFVVLEQPAELRYLRLSKMELPFCGVPAVSGLRAFGKGNGAKPAPIKSVRYRKVGDLNIHISWDAVPGAACYNVRYGIDPKKLYNSWQVRDNRLDLSFINKGEVYYAAVDAVNENGIAPGSIVRLNKTRADGSI